MILTLVQNLEEKKTKQLCGEFGFTYKNMLCWRTMQVASCSHTMCVFYTFILDKNPNKCIFIA